jgi:hypothetical protein
MSPFELFTPQKPNFHEIETKQRNQRINSKKQNAVTFPTAFQNSNLSAVTTQPQLSLPLTF